MKTLSMLLFILLGTLSASAQVFSLDSADAPLSRAGTTTISLVAGGTSGTLKSISCLVASNSVSGTPTAVLQVTLDGTHTTNYNVYFGANEWVAAVAPFVVNYAGNSVGAIGQNEADTFVLPLYVNYTNGLKVAIDVTATATSSSGLLCTALHT